jgi:para-nitrobenzyl esterase
LGPIVETSYGRVAGSDSGTIKSFKGIPYARPPIGARRFRPPEPPEPWLGVLDATRPGRVSIQPSLPWLKFLNAGGASQSEDCLHLNVWSPGLDTGKRPVLVWIHGGGFLIGAGSTPIYEGRNLAERGDMVVVSINYRLGALGYVHLNGVGGAGFEEVSNPGVRDQIAALEWVRDNIAAFGGDPENVTVCGQSAGAMSIGALLGAPRARALMHRAILQSGAAANVLSQHQADTVADIFLSSLGVSSPHPNALANIPVEQILQAQGVTNRRLASLVELMVMMPCVDGSLITETPLEAVARGRTADIPLLVGTTLDEWKLFTPVDSGVPALSESSLHDRFERTLRALSRHAPEPRIAAGRYREALRSRGGSTSHFNVWSAFQSSRVFHSPAADLLDAQAEGGGDGFGYLFSWRPPALGRALGAFHAIELPFIFGLNRRPGSVSLTGLAPFASKLSTRMQDAWISFARSGRPGHENLPEWDAYETASRATMRFDRECSIADGPLEAERELISSWI